MKKTLLFVCTVWLVIASGFIHQIHAQTWTSPTLTGSTLTTGTTYYVYNVGSNGYLNRGGWWATMAVVTAKPTANAAATIIKWTAVNISGSTWTFQYNSGGSDVSGKYLFATGTGGDVFSDNSTNNTWDVVLTDATAKTYSIQVVSTYSGYNSSQYLGSASTTESTNKGIANTVRYNRAGGDNYTQWKFVSQDDLDLYNARVLLDKYMNYAKIRGGIDISSYITTYNAGVTADINTAAANLLTTLGRTDVTSSITNPSFETGTSQTGWTNSGSFANATNTPLFTKDGTNYTEKWTTQGTNLVTGTITQTITGLSNGLYGLVASGHAVQQGPNWNDGSNPLHTGAFFTAGTSSTEVSSGGDYNVDNVMVINSTSGSNGTLTIGFALSGTIACNWTGFDNFRLYYYGAIVKPTLIVSKSSLTFPVPGTKKVAVTGLNLTNNITITAPTHFSVSPSTLLSTVAGDSVAVTYDGGASASGYVVFASGTTKDSVQVSGTAIPTIAPSVAGLLLDDVMLKDSLTVTGANLTSDITITAPTGITVNPTSISKTNATAIKVYVTYIGNTTINDSIVFTSGTLVKKVGIKAYSNAGCFTPLYSSGNLVADPTFSAASLSAGGYGGWGSRSMSTRPDSVYCGAKSGKITGKCGGSMDAPFSSALKSNSVYRLKVAVLTIGGTFKIGMNNLGTGIANFAAKFNTNGKWKIVDTTVITGNNTTCNVMFFNSCESETGTTGYIDNWEFYEAPNISLSSKSITFAGASTRKIAVTANKLTSGITITSPTGFSVTPSTLLSTAAGDSVAITYNGGVTSSGYVYFTSGTVKDSVQVTGTADPTILASLTYLTFDEQNTQGTFTVSAGNLTSGITITAPAGYTVNPSTLSSTANGATVTVTYNGLTESKGYITITSGTTKARVRVLGSIFTPLYATGNLIADPSFNSLSTYEGWGGGKAITKDTTEIYSGVSSLKMTGSCGASTNYKLTGKVQPNTKYRLRLMAKTTGKFKVIAGNFNLVAVGNDDYIITDLNTNGEWKQIDTTFTSGSSFVAADQFLYINSCEGYGGTLALIDNYELYVAPGIAISPKSLTFAGASTKKVAVTGSMLTNDISITAPTGISVMPSTLFSTVAGDSVAITYNNAADVNGYVVFKSGSVKDSVQVTGTALSSDATLSALTISDGTLSPVFAAGTTNYSVEVPVGTVVVPTITTATTTETHATPIITQATSTPGTATVVVTAQDGTTKKTYTVNFTLGAPAAPVAADATTVAKKSFSANWAASNGATGYFLDVATDNAFTAFVIGYNNLNVGNVTTYPVTDLVAATTYYYRVRATNGKVSASSNTISVLSLGTGVQSLAANGLGISVTANAVELESNNAILSVQVVNVNGKLMTEKSINATKATISTEGWASGIYVFTVKTQSQVITTKLGIVK